MGDINISFLCIGIILYSRESNKLLFSITGVWICYCLSSEGLYPKAYPIDLYLCSNLSKFLSVSIVSDSSFLRIIQKIIRENSMDGSHYQDFF